MKKKTSNTRQKNLLHRGKFLIPLIVGVSLLFFLLAFGSGIAFSNRISKIKNLQTPTPPSSSADLHELRPTDTPSLTSTIAPTQKSQTAYSKEQCLRDMEVKLTTFKNTALSQGSSITEVNAFVEMARVAETQKCNAGNFTSQKNSIEKRIDNIEDDLETRKQWEITCGDRGYNVMTGSCN